MEDISIVRIDSKLKSDDELSDLQVGLVIPCIRRRSDNLLIIIT
jgi:hypothetical protein